MELPVSCQIHLHALTTRSIATGLGGYKLQRCLREKRLAREAEDAAAELAEASAAGGSSSSSEGAGVGGTSSSSTGSERSRRKLEEQDGKLVTLPSGGSATKLDELAWDRC